MSDMELLKLAAKAAGYSIGFTDILCWLRDEYDGDGYNLTWNPFGNDGQALRLAAALRFSIIVAGTHVLITLKTSVIYTVVGTTENTLGNMRHAIVCAAAEIGKAMTTAPEARS